MRDKVNIIRAEKSFEFKDSISHPWNPDTIVPGTQLDRLVGMERLRLSVVRLPPGGVACEYHSHECEEEWMYILRGKGVIEIEGTEHLVGPGDFIGFPAPTAAHQLKNAGNHSLVCLMGGEHRSIDVADFPRLGKRMYRRRDKMEIYDTADAEEIGPANIDEVVTNRIRRTLPKK